VMKRVAVSFLMFFSFQVPIASGHC
jgi:hypothetical protein